MVSIVNVKESKSQRRQTLGHICEGSSINWANSHEKIHIHLYLLTKDTIWAAAWSSCCHGFFPELQAKINPSFLKLLQSVLSQPQDKQLRHSVSPHCLRKSYECSSDSVEQCLTQCLWISQGMKSCVGTIKETQVLWACIGGKRPALTV